MLIKDQVVILAGGKGSRISEESISKPKPLIEIGGIPIISHIIDIYVKQGFCNFIICTGYKSQQINEYFFNYHHRNQDFEICLNTGEFKSLSSFNSKINIKIIYTGHTTNTGGRILKIKKHISKNSRFLLTYGDGLANINLKKLVSSHIKNKKIATISIKHLTSKYGQIKRSGNLVTSFQEKPNLSKNFINIGFAVFEYDFFKFLKENDVLEKDTLQRLIQKKQLNSYLHNGRFSSMDSLRDKIELEYLYDKDPFWI